MAKRSRLFIFVASISLLYLSDVPARANMPVTNEIDVTANLVMPSSKSLRGETLFELTISDAHLERARGTCPGLQSSGGTAFKVVGKDKEWEESLLSAQSVLTRENGGIITLIDGRYFGTFVGALGEPWTINGISTPIFWKGYGKKTALRFNTNGWEGGEYTLIGFVSDGCRDFSMVTTKLVLPEIPKPVINCKAPESVFVAEKFEVACESTVELAANGAVIQFKSRDGWQESASMVATGKKFTFQGVQTKETGVLEIRVVLNGVMNLIQDSVSKSFFIQSNAQKLSASPTLVISKSDKASTASITMKSGNNILDAILQGSKSPNGPWADLSRIRSNATISTDLAFGSWVRVKYEGNTAVNAGVSDPYQVLITPTFNCWFPGKIKTGQAFEVTCKANQSLQATPISLQYLNSADNWVTIDKGSASGSEPRFSFNLKGQGRQKLRIRSDGLRDYYTAFVSNTVSVDFTGASSGSSSSSQSSSSSVPKGKVDKNSNAYKLMRTFGENVALNSLASDTAKTQCLSAKNTGLINVRGIRQYLGVQARQIQSYLKTASGFQGCLDGFGK